MKKKEKRYSDVKIHDSLRYFLDANELSFIIHLKRLNGLRACDCRTAYSQEFNFSSFQLSRGIFYRCARRLEELGLLNRITIGKFTDYHLNYENYNRLAEISSATNNIYVLCDFNKKEFILKKRAIDSISESEILELKIKGEKKITF